MEKKQFDITCNIAKDTNHRSKLSISENKEKMKCFYFFKMMTLINFFQIIQQLIYRVFKKFITLLFVINKNENSKTQNLTIMHVQKAVFTLLNISLKKEPILNLKLNIK